jgi:hypothetical protein
MGKSKIDFISDLLASKRLDSSMKQKFFELAAKELQMLGMSNQDIYDRLNEIENKLNNLNNSEQTQSSKIVNEPSKPIFIRPDPEETYLFLTNFNDTRGLRYLIHDFKDPSKPPKRLDLINTAKLEYDELVLKYKKVPEKLKRRIEEFAFSESPDWFIRKGLGKTEIKQGWSSSDFALWYDNQPENLIKHPVRNSKWNQLIIEPFQKSIRIRDGLLSEVFAENIDLVFTNEEKKIFTITMDESNISSADFYTDVDSLKLAIYHILSEIKTYGLKHLNFEIKVTFESGTFKCVKICHVNSKPSKVLNDDFMGGNLKTIRGLLSGLCNWAIDGKFENGNFRQFCLYNKAIKDPRVTLDSEPIGFTHLLYFY